MTEGEYNIMNKDLMKQTFFHFGLNNIQNIIHRKCDYR